MGKIKRSDFATFLDTSLTGTSVWSRMGKGITSQTISYNPATTSETYIDEDCATTTLDSYAPTMDAPQTAYAGDAVFDYIDGLRQSRAIGEDAETDLLLVYIYDETTGNKYSAEKQKVSIQIDDFGGDGGANTVINYTLNFIGEAEQGTCVITDGAPVFTAN